MSNLYSEYLKSLEEQGFAISLLSFLFFCIMWSIGYAAGVMYIVMGCNNDYTEEDDSFDMEEMIKTMNDQGPNN